jgi:methionyl-tRNA formyltransferase
MKIVFLGSADFGIAALQELIKQHSIIGIVTTPPRPKGRGLKLVESPIAAYAQKENIAPVFTPDDLRDTHLVEQLRDLDADCFVVVAFRILPRALFSLPTFGTLNIHASLLPEYRGPAPIHRAIEAGETKTGVTVFRIDDGIDTGEILKQAVIDIGTRETTPELYGRLSVLGAETLITALENLTSGKTSPIEQRSQEGSRAPKLKKSEAVIDWNLSAVSLFNKIRAFKPFPGTYSLLNGKRIGIEWAEPLHDLSLQCQPGTIVNVDDSGFNVQTGNGQLRIVMLRPEGRKSMLAADFIRGSSVVEGDCFNE